MCLEYVARHTNSVQASLKKSGKAVFYKKFSISLDHRGLARFCHLIVTPYKNTKLNLKGEYFVSNRKSRSVSNNEKSNGLRRGIHVYRSKRAATNYVDFKNDIIVPVTCYYSDFVAASGTEAVFMKIKIDKKLLVEIATKALESGYRRCIKEELSNKKIKFFSFVNRGNKSYITAQCTQDGVSRKINIESAKG